ncbi:MAG: hypothetical protein M3N42_13320 [Cyanobacteriota bacterium]|nr:hypothetical protein [Cyanobacteriota bacterium]
MLSFPLLKQRLQLIFWQRGINTPVKRSYPVGNRPIEQFMPATNRDSRTIAPSKLKTNSLAAEYPI